ncbi:lectin [Suillus discolor]|uniref:Lectin n=1 Tax=Suillus discolor TaxID=1912936 RepID=A0A9P7F8E5_9AGAM|nr:lectin [Suillus discolor]XP_041293356.1 lectin [Suillus discolor]KAG2109272.1 lectin [Suillus discolor]KAG2109274.1 lectin [Suillus discolor]
MSYTIVVRVIDATNNNSNFTLAEKTVWHYANGGRWSDTDSIQTLTMGGSGTSGGLRLKSSTGEELFVVLGIHNYKRWCDISTDLTPEDTGMKIHPEYYTDGTAQNKLLWEQLSEIQKTSAKGTKVNVKYVQEAADGKSFVVHITIA